MRPNDLRETFGPAVVFVGRKPGLHFQTVGTGFLVYGHSKIWAGTYVVTAAHVAEICDSVRLRFSGDEEAVEEVGPVSWVRHESGPRVDLAAAELDIDLGRYAHNPVRLDLNREARQPRPRVTDDVYYAGWLDSAPDMTERAIPFARAGIVGATYQEGLPLEGDVGEDPVFVDGHLIDVHGQGGFSGAPCLGRRIRITQSESRIANPGLRYELGIDRLQQSRANVTMYLLGVFLGFYGSADGRGKVLNTGVGIVAPVERVVELLRQDSFTNERRRRRRKIDEQRRANPGVGGIAPLPADAVE